MSRQKTLCVFCILHCIAAPTMTLQVLVLNPIHR